MKSIRYPWSTDSIGILIRIEFKEYLLYYSNKVVYELCFYDVWITIFSAYFQMLCDKSDPTPNLPGAWISNMMYPLRSQGAPATVNIVPQAYPSTPGYYMPHLYQQHSTPGYDAYGMVQGACAYQQLPGMCGTPQGYGNTASSSVSSSPMDHESAGTDSESLKTSPVVPTTEQNEITGVLYKATGGRMRKKPLESGKPPYSYISLICMAISDAPDKKATLREICDFIANRFPYYQTKTTNWHGNIRHNLTLNDCFVKMPRRAGDKGHPWAIDPSFEDMFDNGSLLRRKYRYKPGSDKWTKSLAKAAQRLAAASPKKRGRKAKTEAVPKNALVIPQPDGTSKLVPLNQRDHPAPTEQVTSAREIKNGSVPAHADVVPKPDGTSGVVLSPPISAQNNQQRSDSCNSSMFDLSSPQGKLVIADHSSHNSAGSSFIQATSPTSGVSFNSTSSNPSGSLQTSDQTHALRSPGEQEQSFGCNIQSPNFTGLRSPESQRLQPQHSSALTHQGPSPSGTTSTGLSPSRVHQSPEFHSPPSAGSQYNTLHQPYFNYRGYAACYPMASSTPACSYPRPLGNSYLPSPCSSGSQLYQGLQSDYYSLLSSPESQ